MYTDAGADTDIFQRGEGVEKSKGEGCGGRGFEWGKVDGDCKSHLSFMKLAKIVMTKNKRERKEKRYFFDFLR